MNNPSSCGMLIKGTNGNIFSQIYLPGGEYPKPVVMLCHGIPGNERLFDFAVYLREAGFCTISFHYSGNFGSDGDYSIHNCMSDCHSVIEYIQKNENGWFDTDNVFVVGHSLGGLMAAKTISEEDTVKAGVIIMPFNGKESADDVLRGRKSPAAEGLFNICSLWLKNFSWETYYNEIKDDAGFKNKLSLDSYAEKLAEKPILTIRGTLDTLLPKDENIGALNKRIASYDGGKLKCLEFATDHGMNMERNEIKKAIADFLKENVR